MIITDKIEWRTERSSKVSIIIPVYNVENYIRQCIDSVLAQTFKNLEIILVDDGSPDESGKILDHYANKDNRICVIHKKNGGVSAARNDGLEICSGEYVYLMDSDDYIEPDAIECMVQNAMQTGADVVITDHFFFSDGQEDAQKEKHFFSKQFVTEDRELISKLQNMVLYSYYSPFFTEENTGLGLAAPWTKLIKRSLITDNHLRFDSYVKGIFDDGLFALNIFQFAKKVSYIRYNAYHYRELPTSLMRGFNKERVEINERVFQRIRDFGTKYALGNDFTSAYYARVLLYLNYVFKSYLFHVKFDGDLYSKWKEYRTVMTMASYQEAAEKADSATLRKREQVLVHALRSLPYSMRLFYKLNKK